MTRTKPNRARRPEKVRPSKQFGRGRAKHPERSKPPARSEETSFADADRRNPFGPTFFRTQLRAFLRDEAAEPTDVLPVVEIHLGDRHALDLSHIISITPGWVAVAVHERGDGVPRTRLRTEFIPYDVITRVTLLPVRPYPSQFGFDRARMQQGLAPVGGAAMSPTAAVRTAAGEEETREEESATARERSPRPRSRPASPDR